jgi:hypothetical protein
MDLKRIDEYLNESKESMYLKKLENLSNEIDKMDKLGKKLKFDPKDARFITGELFEAKKIIDQIVDYVGVNIHD